MCFATAAAGASVVGAGLSAVGAIGGGEAAAAAAGNQARMSAYQAQVARNNAITANRQADAEVIAGQRSAEMESLKTAAKVSKVRAGFASRGVDVGTGSAVDVQTSERALGKEDAETVLANSQLRAYGYRARAASYDAQGGLYDTESSAYWGQVPGDITGGYLKAGGTLLSSASSLLGGFGGGGKQPLGTGGSQGPAIASGGPMGPA